MSCEPFLSGEVWVDCLFDADALPLKEPPGGSAASVLGASFEYVYEVLAERRPQERTCRSGWAFALTGAVQAAVLLSYRRRGLLFDNHHMSVEFLLSCTSVPDLVCGCLGAGLCSALLRLSELGLVTFRQFPYVEATAPTDPVSRVSLNYYCLDTSVNDACRPCEPSLADYVETAQASATAKLASFFTVPCMPCVQPVAPRYYPTRPFRVIDAVWSFERRAAAIKRELLRMGPLAAALKVQGEAFRRLSPSSRASAPTQGVFYHPGEAAADGLHAVLVVGYWDRYPETGKLEDRDRAFWVLRSSWPDLGYAIEVDGSEAAGGRRRISGLFNLNMYGAGAGALEGVLSFEEVRITSDPTLPPRALGPDDPLVLSRSLLSEKPSKRSFGSRKILWTLLVLLGALLVAGVAAGWHTWQARPTRS